MSHRRLFATFTVVALGALGAGPADLAVTADGDLPPSGQAAADLPVDPPVASAAVPRGTWTVAGAATTTPSAKQLDGAIDDWTGTATGYAGTCVHDAGELIYTDHLFDAYGADDGTDAQRRAVLGPGEDRLAATYRIEAAINADLPGQAGLPTPPVVGTPPHYGDLELAHHADLVEVRFAANAQALWVLARTTELTGATQTALLVLLDTDGAAGPARDVPFASGIVTERAELAVLLVGDAGRVADLATGTVTELAPGSVATSPVGFDNAIEAALPRDALGMEGPVALAVATGTHDAKAGGFADGGLGANLANVAFRTEEPVREWMDEHQALALHAGSVDRFFVEVVPAELRAGRSDRFTAGPGYHERVFISTTPGLAREEGREGRFQHYGVYLPTAIADLDAERPTLPLQLWLHWRGGTAHAAAAVSPGIFAHMGENRDGIVVSPRGRGTSTWYVGRGHADVLEVLADVEATLPVDADRTYVAGHSMGGWGSYLLSILHPDRFAAALPVAGPVTQGAWTGVDVAGCDGLQVDDYSPCYIQANGGRARDQHTRRMLDNLRNVPVGMFYAGADELVPISGALRQHERLLELGYRHRMYVFPAHEHYSHPIVDEWAAGVRYLDQFVRDPDPPRVTYIRDLAFEAAVNEVSAGGIAFDWEFDHAYWMRGLQVADGADRARFDGRTLAARDGEPAVVPDTDVPTSAGQTGPYTVTGLRWVRDPLAAAAATNGFVLALTGARGVELDLARMRLDTDRTLTGSIRTDHPFTLRLAGDWRGRPSVAVDGASVAAGVRDGALVVEVPTGRHELRMRPRGPRGPLRLNRGGW